MRTDRELLELAAKAVGIELAWSSEPDLSPRRQDNWHIWNPLTEDGDALRLAIDASVRFELALEDSRGYAEVENIYIEFEWDMHRQSDRYSAVRRAIVRVAAESVATKET
jgi:hypothetical protein